MNLHEVSKERDDVPCFFFLISFRSSPLFSRPCPWNGFALDACFISATASDWVTPLSGILRRVCTFRFSPVLKIIPRLLGCQNSKRSTDLSLLSIRIYLESLDSWRLSVKLPRPFSPVDGNGEIQRRDLSLSLLLLFFSSDWISYSASKRWVISQSLRALASSLSLSLSFPRNNYIRGSWDWCRYNCRGIWKFFQSSTKFLIKITRELFAKKKKKA